MSLMNNLRRAKTVYQLFGVFEAGDPYSGFFSDKTNKIADTIEANYYEKPLSADGTPIDIGTWWYGEDGRKWYVVGYRAGKYNITAAEMPCGNPKPLKSKWLRMERPDSWEQIVQDAISLTDTKKKAELIERCKKLAGERND